jgi:hypothetical protein
MTIQVHRYRVGVGRGSRWLYMTAESSAGPLWSVYLSFLNPLPAWRGRLLPSKQANCFLPLGDFADSYHLLQTEDPVTAFIWVEDSDNSVFDAALFTSDEIPGEGLADPPFVSPFIFPRLASS